MALATEQQPSGDISSRRRSGKSASAFRTISEVSKELDLPQHVLRFWETKFPQIKPMKRGGGRRYYRPEDLVMLRRIRGLLYNDGYTIKGVQKLLKESGGKIEEIGVETTELESSSLSSEKATELKAVLTELEDIKKLLS
tara:strand:- start:14480 stop:14899 length:420 start_codon:yes stop_codon:yes gene_type:complete